MRSGRTPVLLAAFLLALSLGWPASAGAQGMASQLTSSQPSSEMTPPSQMVTGMPTGAQAAGTSQLPGSEGTGPSQPANGRVPGAKTVAPDNATPGLPRPPREAASGQALGVHALSGEENGFMHRFTFQYAGDSTTATFRVRLYGLDGLYASAAGFRIFDLENPTSPLEVLTPANSPDGEIPSSVVVHYSSAQRGPVTLEFFSWAPAPVQAMIMNDNPGSDILLQDEDKRLNGHGDFPVNLNPNSGPNTAEKPN